MSKLEQEARCTDLLQMLNARARYFCITYGFDWSDVCGKERVREKRKDKEPARGYKLYHEFQTKLSDHNIAQEGVITWDRIKPLVEEMETLAATLNLEKNLAT